MIRLRLHGRHAWFLCSWFAERLSFRGGLGRSPELGSEPAAGVMVDGGRADPEAMTEERCFLFCLFVVHLDRYAEMVTGQARRGGKVRRGEACETSWNALVRRRSLEASCLLDRGVGRGVWSVLGSVEMTGKKREWSSESSSRPCKYALRGREWV